MRDTLALIWIGGGVLSAGALWATGAMALPDELPLLVAATLVGHTAGRRLFAVLHGDRYERVVLAVLAATAVVALVAAVV